VGRAIIAGGPRNRKGLAKMKFAKCVVFAPVVLAASAFCHAQQKFPLHSGEWDVSTTLTGAKEPLVLRICLNDELWTNALSQNPKCSIQDLKVSAKGVTYLMDCPTATLQMKGKVELAFDGKEHMSGKASIDVIQDGKVSNSTTFVDYRWKAAACSSDDLNLKPNPAK
jgi:hypothetical protein